MAKRTLMYEKAFQALSDAAFDYGIDRIVEDPVDLLMRSLNVSKHAAWSHLNELEKRRIIAFNYEGMRIKSVRIIKNELPDRRFRETDNMTGVLKALWKYRRRSQSNPEMQIVHSGFFSNIQSDADVLQPALYENLKRFSENDWIEIEYSGISRGPRIVYVVIKNEFPTHLV